MKVIQVIHAPTGKILVTERLAENQVMGVMSGDMDMGMYPKPHKITYPGGLSIAEAVDRDIKCKGERLPC